MQKEINTQDLDEEKEDQNRHYYEDIIESLIDSSEWVIIDSLDADDYTSENISEDNVEINKGSSTIDVLSIDSGPEIEETPPKRLNI